MAVFFKKAFLLTRSHGIKSSYSALQNFSSISESQPDAAWNEVERAMFHNKKAKGVQVPEAIKELQETPPIKKLPRGRPKLVKPKEEEIVSDPEIGDFLKLERDSPLLDELMISITSKKHRDNRQLLLLEGRRLVQDALTSGLTMKYLIFSKSEQVKLIVDDVNKSPGKLIKIANHNLKFWSQLTTPPGILGIFERPHDLNALIDKKYPKTLPISIVLDNIREPSNMGALIRVAAAAGIEQVILTKGCTNPWEPKVLRGSAGSQFKIKIVGPIDWEQIAHVLPVEEAEIFVAENKEVWNAINYDGLQLSEELKHKVLIVGCEAHGISAETKAFLREKAAKTSSFVKVPLAQGIESLNVTSAASIILFEMRRKLLQSK